MRNKPSSTLIFYGYHALKAHFSHTVCLGSKGYPRLNNLYFHWSLKTIYDQRFHFLTIFCFFKNIFSQKKAVFGVRGVPSLNIFWHCEINFSRKHSKDLVHLKTEIARDTLEKQKPFRHRMKTDCDQLRIPFISSNKVETKRLFFIIMKKLTSIAAVNFSARCGGRKNFPNNERNRNKSWNVVTM